MDLAARSPGANNPLNLNGGMPITVPGGTWLLTAEYTRLGPDLLLTGSDGQKQLLADYFSSETPSDLMTEGGAVISGGLATKLAGPMAPAQFAQAAPAAAAEPIGRVETVEGGVEVTRADGSKVILGQGAPLFSGDVIETGNGGSVGIILADDSTLSLAENGRMVMDEVAYDPNTESGNATISVVQGVFSFVSGQIAKVGPDAMVLRTPVAQIGIRGTKIAGVAAAEGQENTISLLPDDDGSIGEIAVSNSAGTIVLNQAGATTKLVSAFQAPPKPVIIPVAQIQKQFSKALKSLPPKPVQQDNNPEENQGDGEEAEGEGEAPPEGEGENPEGEGEGEQLADGEVEGEGEGENPEGEDGEIDAQSSEDAVDDVADAQGPEGGPEGEPGPELAENPEQGTPEAAFQDAITGGATTEEAFKAAAHEAMQGMIAEGVSPEQANEAMEAAKDAYQKALADGLSPEQALALAAEAAGAEIPDTLAEGFNTNNPTDPNADGATDELASNFDSPDANSGSDSNSSSDGGGDGDGEPQHAEAEPTAESTDGSEPVNEPVSDGGYNPYSPTTSYYTTTSTFDSGPIGYTQDYYEPIFTYDADPIITLSDPDPYNTEPPPTNSFAEVLNATTGNDSLVGGDGNTQFTMVQGSSLGGTDSVSGGGGTDEINFQSLDNILIVFNAGTMNADYSNADGSVSGSIALTSIEQLFAGVGDGSLSEASGTSAEFNSGSNGVRLSFSSGDTGYGYIAAGSTGADTITLATSTVVGSSPMIYGSLSHTVGSDILGSIIFAGAGADNITGTSSGDIIFGGADNDTIDGGGNSDSEMIFGGAGDDNITVTGSAAVFGGAGSDTLNLGSSGSTVDVKGTETIVGGAGADAVTLGSNLATGSSINLAGGTDSVQLAAGTNTGSISNVETVYGSSSDDTLTLEATVSGTTFDMGGGTDSITLAAGGNTVTLQNTETVTGGSGAGSAGDVLDADGLGFDGAGASTSATTSVESLAADAALAGGTSVVIFDDAFYSGVDSTVALSTQITSFLTFLGSSGTSMTGSLSGGDDLLFVIDDSTTANDISLWHWSDTSADGVVDSGEITDVGTVDNTDISTLVAGNFA
ncbi:MAG: FecR domain-containing protein [Rhodospirillales bacterium]|nr:FecR domain-containing protein [Rhodospirillales bacterium]